MARNSLAALFMLMFASGAFPQRPALTAREAMDAIYKQYRTRLPNCLEVAQARDAAEDDIAWLSRRFGQVGWSKIEPEYVASLNELYYTIRDASDSRDVRGACQAVLLAMRDINIKRVDCRQIGHSRTNIPVEIEIKSGRQAVPDWEVYTRWLGDGGRFHTVPIRLQSLSSPARGRVPIPGQYELFAKDPTRDAPTQPELVAIGGAEVFKWSLQVPSSSQPARK